MTTQHPPTPAGADPAAVQLLLLDVDGVLTDGRLFYGSDGTEFKAFHVRDGAALKQLRHAGVELAIITGRESPMVERRAQELGIDAVVQGADNKASAFALLRQQRPGWAQLAPEHCACIGDDLADLALFAEVGLRMTVADAHPLVLAEADWISSLPGGHGVMREVAELLLRARGQWPRG
ncbi:MAG: HAD hydrolase family protein [Pseudomonadota bacterium]